MIVVNIRVEKWRASSVNPSKFTLAYIEIDEELATYEIDIIYYKARAWKCLQTITNVSNLFTFLFKDT